MKTLATLIADYIAAAVLVALIGIVGTAALFAVGLVVGVPLAVVVFCVRLALGVDV